MFSITETTSVCEEPVLDDITFVPALAYRDPRTALDWLADAFGFELTMAIDGPGGTPPRATTRWHARAGAAS